MRVLDKETVRRLVTLLEDVEQLQVTEPPTKVGALRAEAFILKGNILHVLIEDGLSV